MCAPWVDVASQPAAFTTWQANRPGRPAITPVAGLIILFLVHHESTCQKPAEADTLIKEMCGNKAKGYKATHRHGLIRDGARAALLAPYCHEFIRDSACAQSGGGDTAGSVGEGGAAAGPLGWGCGRGHWGDGAAAGAVRGGP